MAGVAYNRTMSRDLQVRLARSGLWLGLVLLATAGAAAIVFGSPETVKQAVRDSKLYQAATNLLTDIPSGQVGPAAQPAVESAAAKAFSSDQLQQSSESAIDSIYSWLDGSEPEPQFRVDLTPLRDSFIANISAASAEYLDNLPACTPAQLQALDAQATDPMSLPCRPPGLTAAAATEQTVATLQADNELFRQPILTADSLPKNEQGQNAFQAATALPTTYQALQLVPWLTAGLCIVMVGLIFLWSPNAMRAGYIISKTTLWAGLSILVLVGLSHVAFSVLTQPGSSIAQAIEGTPQSYMLSFARSLEGSLSRLILQIAAGYFILGWLTIVVLRLVAMRQQKAAAGSSAPTATPQI